MPTRAIDRLAFGASACVLLLFLVRAGAALVSVPPWQNPDEPQHVMAIWFAGAADQSEESVAGMERAVIESMARHRWWHLVGELTPDPLPSRFADDRALTSRWIAMPRSAGLYYALAGWLTSGPDPEQVLASARRLSAAAGLGVILLGVAVARSLLGQWSGVGVGAVLALHPQFLLVATTASADAFIALLSTAAIWMTVAALSSKRPQAWIAAAALPTAAAVLSRKLGLTVLPVACWAVAVVVSVRRRDGAVRLGLSAAVALAIVGSGVGWWYASELRQAAADVARQWQGRPPEFDVATGLAGLHRSAWMTAGWLRFGPGEAWHVMAGLVSAVAAVGVGAVTLWPRRPGVRIAAILATGAVALQVAAVLGRQFVAGEVSQGRYLAPVAVPLALLLWLGTVEAAPSRARRLAALALLLWLAAFDASSWAQVIWAEFW